MKRTRARSIASADRTRIRAALSVWAVSGSFYGLRTRAVVELAWSSGLRLKELLALNLDQVLEQSRPNRFTVRSQGYLRAPQSKGRRQGPTRSHWDSAGPFVITAPARRAIRAYLKEAVKRQWLKLPPTPATPLFITIKDRGGGQKHERLGRRAVQVSWNVIQKKALLVQHYKFHELRHDAITRHAQKCGGDVFEVSAFGRLDAQTALRYVHYVSVEKLLQTAEAAAR